MTTTNPLTIDVLPSLALDEEWLTDLVQDIEAADDSRQEWLSKQRKLTEQRYGIKTTKRTVPWPGASDIRIPTIDKAIRRWKPKILSLVFDSDPIAYFRASEAGDMPAARVAEAFFDWYFKYHMDESLEEVCYLADMVAHRGFAVLQVSWNKNVEVVTRVVNCRALWPQGPPEPAEIVRVLVQEYDIRPEELNLDLVNTIRAGAEFVTLTYKTTVADKAQIVARDPVDVVVPPRATSFQDARYVCIRHNLSVDDLRERARQRKMYPEAVERVADNFRMGSTTLPASGQRTSERSSLDAHAGLSVADDEYNVEVWEVYTWTPFPERQRAVLWYHPETKTILFAAPFPYPIRCWPFIRFDAEKCTRGWYNSRGLSRLLSPLARSVDRLHNAKLDAITIQLAPAFKHRAPSGLPPRTFQFGPAKTFPVTELSDFVPVEMNLQNLVAYTQTEYEARQYAEDYAGIYDSSLMSPLRPQERRTAAEINLVAATMQGSFSLDAKLFQRAMGRAYAMIWDLFLEFGPDELFFRVQNEEFPIHIRKADIAGSYDIVPAGTPSNTNKMLELAQIKEAMQIMVADQTGVINRGELFSRYLELLNWQLARRVINPPEKQTQNQILMQAAQTVASGQLQAVLDQATAAQEARVQGAVTPGAMAL